MNINPIYKIGDLVDIYNEDDIIIYENVRITGVIEVDVGVYVYSIEEVIGFEFYEDMIEYNDVEMYDEYFEDYINPIKSQVEEVKKEKEVEISVKIDTALDLYNTFTYLFNLTNEKQYKKFADSVMERLYEGDFDISFEEYWSEIKGE